MEISHYLFMLFAQTCIKHFFIGAGGGMACILRYKQIRALNIKINGMEEHLEICARLGYKKDWQILSTTRTCTLAPFGAEALMKEGK